MLPKFSLLIFILVGAYCENFKGDGGFYSPTSNEITLHGRYYMQQNSVMYDWICFKIDFCFQNSKKVIWNVVDTWNIYHVVIDSNTTKVIHPKKDQKITIFQSSAPESHCIQIIKITQNHYGPIASHKDSVFNGIQIEEGTLVKNPKRYDYKFDFLGDSLTAGFGIMSGTNPICFLKIKSIENCRQSWATHISKMFNADYRIEAGSGKGVVRNSIGVPGAKISALFSRVTDNSEDNSYKMEDHYFADALFVYIGTNDYRSLKAPSINNFLRGYNQMLQKIVKDYLIYAGSGPVIISVCDIENNKELCYNVKTAVKNFSYSYKFVHYVEIPEGTISKQYLGCDGHPNAKGQMRVAQALYPKVRQILSQ